MKKFIEPEETMGIYSLPGSKIVFTGENGQDWEQVNARKFLSVGKEYTLKSADVFSCSTEICLEEFPKLVFNSVLFKNKEQSDETKRS